MNDIALALFIRASALMTIFIVLTASAWVTLKKLGYMRLDQSFSATDLRTWSLSFAIIDAAIYGVIFAIFQTALGNNLIAIGFAAASATFIAMRIVPR